MNRLSITVLALFLATGTPLASGPDATVTFEVEKMTCATCPITVRKAMQRVDGVKDVRVSYDEKTASVTFDPTVTTATEIGQASTDVGFPAVVSETE
ncbi:MAG TPA: cation transporter [Woeseiaceae bacterium]|jgi:mercuric ion binding protein|nr:cation transporter [Woeseiaceae bacterium]